MNYCSYIQCNNTWLLKQRARSVPMSYIYRKDAQDTVLSENESCRSFVYDFYNLHTHMCIHTHTRTHTPMCGHAHSYKHSHTHAPGGGISGHQGATRETEPAQPMRVT